MMDDAIAEARARLSLSSWAWSQPIVNALEALRPGASLEWAREIATIVLSHLPPERVPKSAALLSRFVSDADASGSDLSSLGEAAWIAQDQGDIFQRAVAGLYWATSSQRQGRLKEYLEQCSWTVELLASELSQDASAVESVLAAAAAIGVAGRR